MQPRSIIDVGDLRRDQRENAANARFGGLTVSSANVCVCVCVCDDIYEPIVLIHIMNLLMSTLIRTLSHKISSSDTRL